MAGYIETVPARELRVGDVFSTDGYTVEAAVLLLGRGVDGEVWVQTRRGDDPRCKNAYLPLDHPCPLWRENGGAQ